MVQSDRTTLNAPHSPSLPTESLKPVNPRLATRATSSAHLRGTQAAHRNAVFASSHGVSQRPRPQQTPSHGGISPAFYSGSPSISDTKPSPPQPSRLYSSGSPGERPAQKYISLLALIAGALAGLSLGGVYDLITDGRFLGPLIQNIQVNLEPSAELTRSSPLSYLGILLVLACPWVLPKIQWAKLRLSPTYWALIVGALSFIVVHSATPHKEERFLYPILPMLLLIFGLAWFALPTTSIKLRKSLVVFHLSLTVILFTVHPQIATRQALEGLRDTEASALISLGPEIQSFFIRPLKADIARNRKFTPAWLNAAIKQKTDEAFFVLSYQAQAETVESALAENQLKCDAPAVFEQNWADALAFKLNPRHNLRRSPIETRLCRR